MSAVALNDDEWEFPPEWKRDRKAEAKLRAMLCADDEEPSKPSRPSPGAGPSLNPSTRRSNPQLGLAVTPSK